MNILLLRRTGPSVGACHSRWLSQQMAPASATAAAPLQRQQRQQSQQPQAHPQPQQHFPSAFLQAALNGTGSGSNGSSGPKTGAATATATAAATTVSASAAAAGASRTDTATATAAPPPPQRPYPAHVVDGREEEMVERWCQKTPQPVSLRTLVQVGLGRRPFLSSLRDACSLRDALNSLNTRLQINANTTSAEEKGVLRMATFLHRELPIRFARGVQFIDRLDLYREAPDLRQIRDCYVESFKEVLQSPSPVTPECEADFVKLLEGVSRTPSIHPSIPPLTPSIYPILYQTKVRDRHADELLMVARGVYQLRARLGVEILGTASSFDELHAHLDELHLKRWVSYTFMYVNSAIDYAYTPCWHVTDGSAPR